MQRHHPHRTDRPLDWHERETVNAGAPNEERLFAGRFEIGPLLGMGGMAMVHVAFDRELQFTVALKRLHPRLAREQDARLRFARELKMLGRVSHPRIVRHIDSDSEHETPFAALELLEGGSLHTWVTTHGPLTSSEALTIGVQIATALEALGEREIVHRDLKMSNVLLVTKDVPAQVKLADLGIACDGRTRITEEGVVAGSGTSIAPEQIVGAPVDARTDVYGLGMLLYRLVTGEPAFTAETMPRLLAHQLLSPAPPPSALSPWLAPEVDRVVLTALQKNPAHRYPTATAMRCDLERLLGGRRDELTGCGPQPYDRYPAQGPHQTQVQAGMADELVR